MDINYSMYSVSLKWKEYFIPAVDIASPLLVLFEMCARCSLTIMYIMVHSLYLIIVSKLTMYCGMVYLIIA